MAKQEAIPTTKNTDWTNILEMDMRIKDQLTITTPKTKKDKTEKQRQIDRLNKKTEDSKATILSLGYKKRSVKAKIKKGVSGTGISNEQLLLAYQDVSLFEAAQSAARRSIAQNIRILENITNENPQILIKGLISNYIVDKYFFLNQKKKPLKGEKKSNKSETNKSKSLYILRKELSEIRKYKKQNYEELMTESQKYGFDSQEKRINDNILIILGRENEVSSSYKEKSYPIFYQVFASNGIIILK